MLNYIYEIEGKTKTEAESMIMNTLRLKENEVKFVAVETPGSTGKFSFFGISPKKPVLVRAYAASKDVPIEKIIHGVTLTLFKKMGIDVDVVGMGDVDGKLYIELASSDSGIIIGKRGSTLDSIQFLLNLMIDSKLRNGKKIILDIESYRDKREMSLVRLSKSIATSVARSGRPKLLEPMNPYERRIIHMTLQTDDRVFTKSEGTGTYKRVRIIAMKDKHKYPDEDITKELQEEDDEKPE